MNKDTTNKLRDISKKYYIKILVLFGSRAIQTNNKNSDYDLAFYKKNISAEDEYELFNNIMEILKTQNIDLINIQKNTDATLRNNIFQKGICIYEKNKFTFENMQVDALMDYIDFKEIINSRDFAFDEKEISKI